MLPKKQIALAFAILYTIYIIARTCDLYFPEVYLQIPMHVCHGNIQCFIWNLIFDFIRRSWRYQHDSVFNSLLVKRHFLKWFLIDRQNRRHLIRSHVNTAGH